MEYTLTNIDSSGLPKNYRCRLKKVGRTPSYFRLSKD